MKKNTLILLTCIFVIFLSIKNTTNQSNSSDSLVKKTKIETNEAKNPTPENVQVLGIIDLSKLDDNQTENFNKQVLYNLINSYRKENNLNKLFINKLLEDSTNRKLADMVDKNYFRHVDTNNNESWYLFNAAGYNYKFAGENLSSGYNTPWQVFTAWQASSVHNEQLLKSEYADMGLAVNCNIYRIENKPACIVVLHLGSR